MCSPTEHMRAITARPFILEHLFEKKNAPTDSCSLKILHQTHDILFCNPVGNVYCNSCMGIFPKMNLCSLILSLSDI